MSRKYKFHNQQGLYFVSFAVIHWIDLFTRDDYCKIILQSLDYCQKNKGLELYCWCIMPSHIHFIFRAKYGDPSSLLGRIKEFTSKKIRAEIKANPFESRKEWILRMMESAGKKSSNVSRWQLWQHHNQPIELWSPEVIDQKMIYIHLNPVKAGYVSEPWHWKYSSAINFNGGKGELEIDYL